MKARVDPVICIGCGLCVQMCPEVFRMEEDKAVAYVDSVPEDAKATCQEAVQACPVTAITVEE